MLYLETLLMLHCVWCQIQAKWEMWKGVVVALLRYYLGIFL